MKFLCNLWPEEKDAPWLRHRKFGKPKQTDFYSGGELQKRGAVGVYQKGEDVFGLDKDGIAIGPGDIVWVHAYYDVSDVEEDVVIGFEESPGYDRSCTGILVSRYPQSIHPTLISKSREFIRWDFNNGSYAALVNNRYTGLVSQAPDDPAVMNPGMWSAAWRTADGGSDSSGCIYETEIEAIRRFSIEVFSESEGDKALEIRR